MVTQQEIGDVLAYRAALNADGGRGTMAAARRTVARVMGKYGAAGIERIEADQQFIEYVRTHSSSGGGFFGGLFSGIANFAGQAGIKEGLLLGGMAFGASSAGLFGGGASSGAVATAGGNVAAVSLESGVTAAVEQAAMVSAASAPGVLGADAAIAAMNAAEWGVMSTGTMSTAISAASLVQNLPVPRGGAADVVKTTKGADMATVTSEATGWDSVLQGIGGAAGRVVDAWADAEVQRIAGPQNDPVIVGSRASGGGNNTALMMGGLGLAALLVLMVALRK